MSDGTPVSTGKLGDLLKNSEDINKDWESLSSLMTAPPFHEYMQDLIAQKGLDPAQLGVTALLSRSFSYQICSGERIPERDTILKISLGLKIDLDTTQRLLTLARRGVLYPKNKRDAAIIYAVSHGLGIYKADEFLTEIGEKPIL